MGDDQGGPDRVVPGRQAFRMIRTVPETWCSGGNRFTVVEASPRFLVGRPGVPSAAGQRFRLVFVVPCVCQGYLRLAVRSAGFGQCPDGWSRWVCSGSRIAFQAIRQADHGRCSPTRWPVPTEVSKRSRQGPVSGVRNLRAFPWMRSRPGSCAGWWLLLPWVETCVATP